MNIYTFVELDLNDKNVVQIEKLSVSEIAPTQITIRAHRYPTESSIDQNRLFFHFLFMTVFTVFRAIANFACPAA